jgi:hypothetical protein
MAGRVIPLQIGDVELLAEVAPVAGSEATSARLDRAQDVVNAGFLRRFACQHVQDSANPRAFPGGTPEREGDGDLVAALVREAFEENQVRGGATAYYGGSAHSFGFVIYSAARAAYEGALLLTGPPVGTPQEALDTACTIHLADLGHEPTL